MNMNLLIVDDQASVVQGLSCGISWKMMGFEHVYKAYNAQEARALFRKHEIQIMLCDIEMPGENGIMLLKIVAGRAGQWQCQ